LGFGSVAARLGKFLVAGAPLPFISPRVFFGCFTFFSTCFLIVWGFHPFFTLTPQDKNTLDSPLFLTPFPPPTLHNWFQIFVFQPAFFHCGVVKVFAAHQNTQPTLLGWGPTLVCLEVFGIVLHDRFSFCECPPGFSVLFHQFFFGDEATPLIRKNPNNPFPPPPPGSWTRLNHQLTRFFVSFVCPPHGVCSLFWL